MKSFVLLCWCCVAAFAFARAEPQTNPPAEPVLQVFAAKVKGAEMTQMSYDDQHPLMVIQGVKEVRLARDGKGVMLVLKEDDVKPLADMTRDYDGLPLIFVVAGGVIRPLTINGEVKDGRLGFKYPEAAPIAEALRRYYRIGEFQ